MSDISPVGGEGIARVRAPGRTEHTEPGRAAHAKTARGEDQVEVSPLAQYLRRLQELPSMRVDVIERVRADIDKGVYETPEKVDAAIDRLIEEEGL